MRKIFYAIGAFAAIATPVVAVVSCGSKKVIRVEETPHEKVIVGTEGQKIETTSKVEEITSRLESGDVLKNALAARYDNYNLYPSAPWNQSSLVSGYNNNEMKNPAIGGGLVLDKYVPQFGNFLKESFSNNLPMFEGKVSANGVTDYKSLDFKIALEITDASPMYNNSTKQIDASNINEAFNKFFDKIDEYTAEMNKRISDALVEISNIYKKPVPDIKEAIKILQTSPSNYKLGTNHAHARYVFELLSNWDKKEMAYSLDKQPDGSYLMKAYFISKFGGLENGYPVHIGTELVAGDGDLSIIGVEKHLSKYLSLSATNKNFTRYEGSMRFGREEIQGYHLDEKNLWKNAGGKFSDGYTSGQGWNRFNGNFEIFTDVYPAFGQDYSHPGKLDVNYLISDRKYAGLTDYYHFGTVEDVDFSKNPMSSTAAPTDRDAAKAAIIELSKIMKNMAANDKQKIVQYLDAGLIRDLENLLVSDETQAFLNAHIDDILNQWIANPALDATIMASQASVFNHPTMGSLITWLMADKHEKWNMFVGLRFLQWYVKTNMPSQANSH